MINSKNIKSTLFHSQKHNIVVHCIILFTFLLALYCTALLPGALSSLVKLMDWCIMPSHYLNHCWLFINWPFRNETHWNLNKERNYFDIAAKGAPFYSGINVSKGEWLTCSKIECWFNNKICTIGHVDLGSILLTWINFNPSMDK